METKGSQVVRDKDSEAARGQIRSQVFVEVRWDYFGEVRLQCHDLSCIIKNDSYFLEKRWKED